MDAMPKMYCKLGPLYFALLVVCLILHQLQVFSPLHREVTRLHISGELFLSNLHDHNHNSLTTYCSSSCKKIALEWRSYGKSLGFNRTWSQNDLIRRCFLLDVTSLTKTQLLLLELSERREHER
jgi:hypothetical protein